jgi:hypothetical protein
MRDGAPNRFGSERKRAPRPLHTGDSTLCGKEGGWLFANYY